MPARRFERSTDPRKPVLTGWLGIYVMTRRLVPMHLPRDLEPLAPRRGARPVLPRPDQPVVEKNPDSAEDAARWLTPASSPSRWPPLARPNPKQSRWKRTHASTCPPGNGPSAVRL